ncbi:interferon-induced, double-stranded RNA-activated protein kinase isoform X2 [Dromaius novaehollandiae]|uniref:interferon-induced, double-stranded RNA-activated protein kinase isoform X2 n=1 Tax=Dromaius novaehollandiae TaxID=8790 RepID=UPI000E1F25AC|nr:interferon-induced, double-stranded RNA-activated protein kinase isoform X2 [Dromaius novaehollandiae]
MRPVSQNPVFLSVGSGSHEIWDCAKMERDYMGKINNYCQKNKLEFAWYDIQMTGPSHDPEFTVMLKINDEEYGTGTGRTKKEAKAAAARKSWQMIEEKQSRSSNVQNQELMTSPVTLLRMPTAEVLPAVDYVSRLNTFSQKKMQVVDYNIRTVTGEDRALRFLCTCTVSGHVYGNGTGISQAAAKQAAAKQAYEKLDEQGDLTGRETSNISSTTSKSTNSYGMSNLSDSKNMLLPPKTSLLFFRDSGISFEDSCENLVENMKNMVTSEKPLPSQRNAQRSALKSKRKLAAKFDKARNEEESMSDSDESSSDLDTSDSEDGKNAYTVDKRFLKDFKNIVPIGEGGFGNVFKATAKIVEKTYAVKRVQLTKNVKREVKELAGLDHENIVRYYSSWKGKDYVTYPDSRQRSSSKHRCLFIQMELCEQGPLENWIENNREKRNYQEMAQDKFLQIVKGVEYIHSKGLIHRDLKPQNIFISNEDKIKIGDFGLVTSEAYNPLTENRGTKSYMAPEQFGDRYGKEVDIYALGLIWFEILSALASCHEKNKVWKDVKEGTFPESFTEKFATEAPMIKKMLSRDQQRRPSASQILLFLKSVEKDNSLKAHTY